MNSLAPEICASIQKSNKASLLGFLLLAIGQELFAAAAAKEAKTAKTALATMHVLAKSVVKIAREHTLVARASRSYIYDCFGAS